MASPFNTSSIPHHTHLKNRELQTPHSTASSVKVHDTRQPHEPQSSPHTQTGSYNPLFAVVPQRHCFNPRSHVGSDLSGLSAPRCGSGFNPRSRMGSDLSSRGRLPRTLLFQSTLPHGERHQPYKASCHHYKCFNPRSHVGSDCMKKCLYMLFGVSIHAPPWGAPALIEYELDYEMFQSTLPRGERLNLRSHSSHAPCFNPRSHVGSDQTAYMSAGAQ